MNLSILSTDTCFWIATPMTDIEWYEKIYKIKDREYSKPLAILVMDFEWLKENTTLNNQQIDFLIKYKKPFTILTETRQDILPDNLPNKSIYKKLAFRVTQTFMQRSLIQEHGPLFLTSANKSWEPEIFSTKDIRESFKDELRKYSIKVFAHPNYEIKSEFSSSDIFEFIWDTTEVKYIRRN